MCHAKVLSVAASVGLGLYLACDWIDFSLGYENVPSITTEAKLIWPRWLNSVVFKNISSFPPSRSSVPQSAAQAVHQVLAAVATNQASQVWPVFPI